MKNKLFAAFILSALFFMGCKKDSNSAGGGASTPTPGSARSITVDMTYFTGLIEGTASWAAWPMIKFPVDNNAKSYKVRLYGFKNNISGLEGKVYTWLAGQLPPTTYNIYTSTKGIKDGDYYVSVDRTWCSGPTSGCNESTAQEFVTTYKTNWGTPKAEVTYQY